MNFFDFDDRIEKERNNTKAIYINKHLFRSLKSFAKQKNKKAKDIAEYFICLGINSVKHNQDQNIKFDIKNL